MLTTAIPASDAPERSADASTPAPGRRTSSAVAVVVALAVIGASGGIAYRGGREVALVAAGTPVSTGIAGLDGERADPPPQPFKQPSAEVPPSAPAADAAAAPSSTVAAAAAPDTGSFEEEALQQFSALRATSLGLATLDGRWVAQVASKDVGSVDPLQTASDGTHVFGASDVLAEHQRLSNANADADRVLLLTGTDFGQRSTSADGEPYWITLVDRRFTSSAAVRAWCATAFAGLTPQQRADACAPRTLTPPH